MLEPSYRDQSERANTTKYEDSQNGSRYQRRRVASKLEQRVQSQIYNIWLSEEFPFGLGVLQLLLYPFKFFDGFLEQLYACNELALRQDQRAMLLKGQLPIYQSQVVEFRLTHFVLEDDGYISQLSAMCTDRKFEESDIKDEDDGNEDSVVISKLNRLSISSSRDRNTTISKLKDQYEAPSRQNVQYVQASDNPAKEDVNNFRQILDQRTEFNDVFRDS